MQLSFQYGDTAIEFEVSYSRRKTISISVEAPGRVKVIAPLGLYDDEIISRVKSKARWIVQKLYEVKNVKTEGPSPGLRLHKIACTSIPARPQNADMP